MRQWCGLYITGYMDIFNSMSNKIYQEQSDQGPHCLSVF